MTQAQRSCCASHRCMIQSHALCMFITVDHYKSASVNRYSLFSILDQQISPVQTSCHHGNVNVLATPAHNDEIFCARQSLSSPGNPTVTSLQVPWATLNCKHAHLLVATVTASTIHQITDGAGRHSLCATGYKNCCCLLLCCRCSSPVLASVSRFLLTLLCAFLRCNLLRVRMSDTARSQPWTPPGRGSDRATSGGGLREAESNQLRNQMMRNGEPPRMGPPLEAWQTRDRRPVGTISQCKGWITNQEQHNKYPCYRIRDTQSL